MKRNRILSFCLIFAMLAAVLPGAGAAWTWGDLSSETQTQVAPDAVYKTLLSETSSGKQRIHALEFDLTNEYLKLRAGKTYGNVYGSQTVLGITNELESEYPGQVVAGINADFFDMGYGVPFGIFLEDGKLLSTPPQYSSSFGLKQDGTPFVLTHGTILNKILVVKEKKIELSGMNNRIKDADSLMFYTADYGTSTRVKEESLEIICSVLSGEARHGERFELRVDSIRSGEGNAPLEDGKIVISATGARIAEIEALEVGEELSAYFEFNQFWQDVSFAVGGNYTLLKDGEVQDVSDNARNPRTMVGFTEGGTIVFATIDGRQTGFAAGATLKEAAAVMRDLGCTHALNLDGGGSTTFVLRAPGAMKRAVVNSPSGSSARQVANALVLINTAPRLTPNQLMIRETKRTVLAGGRYAYSLVGAMDDNYQPHEVDARVEWAISPELGVITPDGVLETPLSSAGTANLSATAGTASGSTQVTIVDTVDEIRCAETQLVLEPGQEKSITVTLMKDNTAVEHTNDLLVWELDPALGSVTEPGKIRAGEVYAEGNLTIRHQDTSLTIPVVVNGKKTITFDDLSGFSWAEESIYALAEKEIIRGVSATEFAPERPIKRADFMLLLVRMMGIDTSEKPAENFADVPESAYYYNELGAARKLGIAQGVSATEFAPGRNITRQEMFALTWRVLKQNGHIAEDMPLTALDSYKDKGAIASYAQNAIATLAGLGFVKGDSNACVNPKNPANRAEAAVFIARVDAFINPISTSEEDMFDELTDPTVAFDSQHS